MDLTGIITKVLPERSGTSQKGDWRCASYVMQVAGLYPKFFVFDVFGAEKISEFGIKEGDNVNVQFSIEAHEYQGRWFNSVRAFGVTKRPAMVVQQQPITQQPFPSQQTTQSPQQPVQPQYQPQQQSPQQDNGAGDLPF